jgi:hypothetical protein
VLFAIFPEPFKALSIWVVESTDSITIITFEVTVVDLTVWPHVDPFTILFTSLESSEE